MATKEELEQARLRKFLNKAIKGKNTDAVLAALATGDAHNSRTIEAVNDQLFIVSAEGQFLDSKLADNGVVRPGEVGLSDEVFRSLGIAISARKQVRDLISEILEVFYGPETARATVLTGLVEPYALQDGDNLSVTLDDSTQAQIVFKSDDFTNINAATAQEVSDAITKSFRDQGLTASAIIFNQDTGNFVRLISGTIGPSSSLIITGGKAQNILRFPQIRTTSNTSLTQWTLSIESGSIVRYTWTGGPNPSVGKIREGDYANVFGTSFNVLNRGTFNIVNIQGGTIGNAFVDVFNPVGVAEIVTQGTDSAILFFEPQRRTLNSESRFTGLFQSTPGVLQVFLPATTRIVRRFREGAGHIPPDATLSNEFQGPFLFNPNEAGVSITENSLELDQEINRGQSFRIVDTKNTIGEIPDDQGFILFDFGTSSQEGPVRYIGRPSATSLALDPSHIFRFDHATDSDITLISDRKSHVPKENGSDFPVFLTGSVSGRIFAEQLLLELTATGITLIITVLFPGDIGLGKFGTPNSDKFYVWGE